MSELPPMKRARFACERCRSRKQKCDSDGYSCTNCSRVKLKCVVSELKTQQYIKMLEERVTDLEEQIAKKGEGGANNIQSSSRNENGNNNISSKQGAGGSTALTSTISSKNYPSQQSSLLKCAAFISLGAEAEPHYLGSSSGLNLVSLAQEAVWKRGLTLPPMPVSGGGASNTSGPSPISPQADHQHHLADSLLLLSPELEVQLIESYINLVHCRFPVLDKKEIWNIHDNRKQVLNVDKDETAALGGGNGISTTTKQRELHLDKFQLLMVYAIGLRHAQLVDKDNFKFLSPELFYESALEQMQIVISSVDIRSIQCTVLGVLYLLRASTGPGIWLMIGLAMRMCVELGFHRKEPSITVSSAYHTIMRRRIFWCSYSLERLICQSLGRPLSVSERDIDVDLPFDIDEDITDNEQLYKLMTDSSSQQQQTSLSFAFHFFKLRRIDSQIQETIHRVDRDVLPPFSEIIPILSTIEEWRRSAPKNVTHVEQYHIDLMYNKSIRLTIVPYLGHLKKEDKYCEMCLRSAGAICRLSKKLHQEGPYAHSFIALQTVFMCGLTVIYGLLSEKLQWDYQTAEDLQACSTVMFVVAERSPGTRRFRDVFEALLSKTMRHVLDPTSRQKLLGSSLDYDEVDNNTTAATTVSENSSSATNDEPWIMGNNNSNITSVTDNSVPGTSGIDTSTIGNEHWESMSIKDLWRLVHDTAWPDFSSFGDLDLQSWDGQDLNRFN